MSSAIPSVATSRKVLSTSDNGENGAALLLFVWTAGRAGGVDRGEMARVVSAGGLVRDEIEGKSVVIGGKAGAWGAGRPWETNSGKGEGKM